MNLGCGRRQGYRDERRGSDVYEVGKDDGTAKKKKEKKKEKTLICYDTDTVCKFWGKSPSPSDKTTLKQQLNG